MALTLNCRTQPDGRPQQETISPEQFWFAMSFELRRLQEESTHRARSRLAGAAIRNFPFRPPRFFRRWIRRFAAVSLSLLQNLNGIQLHRWTVPPAGHLRYPDRRNRQRCTL